MLCACCPACVRSRLHVHIRRHRSCRGCVAVLWWCGSRRISWRRYGCREEVGECGAFLSFFLAFFRFCNLNERKEKYERNKRKNDKITNNRKKEMKERKNKRKKERTKERKIDRQKEQATQRTQLPGRAWVAEWETQRKRRTRHDTQRLHRWAAIALQVRLSEVRCKVA